MKRFAPHIETQLRDLDFAEQCARSQAASEHRRNNEPGRMKYALVAEAAKREAEMIRATAFPVPLRSQHERPGR